MKQESPDELHEQVQNWPLLLPVNAVEHLTLLSGERCSVNC